MTHFSPPFCDRKQIRMKRRLARFADDVPDPDDRVFPAQMRIYKRRRCEKKTRRSMPQTSGASSNFYRSTTRTEGSSERHRLRSGGRGGEEQQRPTCPPAGLAAGTTSMSPLADRPLSHFLRITLRIYESSPSLRWKTGTLNGGGVPPDATETGQEQTRKREVEDVERICASFPATQNKRNSENRQARKGPDGFVSATVPSPALRFLSAPSFLTLPQPVNRHPVDLLKLGSPSCTSVPSWQAVPSRL